LLLSQANLQPGMAVIDQKTNLAQPVQLKVSLIGKPKSLVMVRGFIPKAWDGSPLATLKPSGVNFTAKNYATSAIMQLTMSNFSQGDFNIDFLFMYDPPLLSACPASISTFVSCAGEFVSDVSAEFPCTCRLQQVSAAHHVVSSDWHANVVTAN
jgi:hypothetical protein